MRLKEFPNGVILVPETPDLLRVTPHRYVVPMLLSPPSLHMQDVNKPERDKQEDAQANYSDDRI